MNRAFRRGQSPVCYDSAAAHPDPPSGSVPVTTIILAKDEGVNITRATRSVGWCRQVVVVDSGSTDSTPDLAQAAGAQVLTEPWRGYSAQREWAMRQPAIAHDWVFFLDADEWVSVDLATEIARRITPLASAASERAGDGAPAAFSMRRRLVFAGHWIAHCGWYTNSWQARLLHRRRCHFDPKVTYGERATVTGPVARLAADLVDEDQKGIAAWLRKHVDYAELEARRRAGNGAGLAARLRAARCTSRPIGRTIAKEVIFPLVPAKPVVLFCYMYLLRAGWRDGSAGLVFCFYHAWYELTVGMLHRSPRPPMPSGGNTGVDTATEADSALDSGRIPMQRPTIDPPAVAPDSSTLARAGRTGASR